jgi:uncharacterized repeat protein (TIGR03837 family)
LRPRRWDLFCRVVDNYGDAAVCWRLAAQLAREHGAAVRLYIDQPPALALLVPELDLAAAQPRHAGVEVRRWDAIPNGEEVADVIVDGFGCGPPEPYLDLAEARAPQPLWIVLEYLSAEPWVAGHHALPSPHPRRRLERHFWFPGFAAGTGGLLREAGLLARRTAFRSDPAAAPRFWRDHGFEPVPAGALAVSLFGYEQPALPALLDACAAGPRPVVGALTASRIRPEALAWAGARGARDGEVIRRGQLELRLLPFVSQARYDELLWSCDWNFVRGEDSLVRALWAARPLVWQIYPQAEAAHCAKLDAFLGLGGAAGDAPARETWRQFNRLWSGCPGPDAAQCLGRLWTRLAHRDADALAAHAARVAAALADRPDLASSLVAFCAARLK